MSVSDFLAKLSNIKDKNDYLQEIIQPTNESEIKMLGNSKKLGDELFALIPSLEIYCKSCDSDIKARQKKLENIREILKNKEIQIIFVGGVSSGKSKIINAVVQEEIFPSSIGATTTCIVKLTGSNEDKSLITYKDKKINYDNREALFEEIMNISMGLGDDPIENNDHVQVYLSHPICSILNNKIFLIDTPGYDRCDTSKSIVMDVCQVSDIVIFVMTYVFSEEEKDLFKSLSEKTSKLNMYILINKWDESDNDETETVQTSRNVIEDRLIKWFQENNEMKEELAKERIFFISAMEEMDSLTETDEEINEFRKNEFERFTKALKNSLDNPEFCKCLKHEGDINNMESNLKAQFVDTINTFKEFINSREHSISELKKVLDSIETNRKAIIEKLNFEKEKKIVNIQNYIKSSKSWLNLKNYLPSKSKKEEVELMDLGYIVREFDEILNTMEKDADEELSNIAKSLKSRTNMKKENILQNKVSCNSI